MYALPRAEGMGQGFRDLLDQEGREVEGLGGLDPRTDVCVGILGEGHLRPSACGTGMGKEPPEEDRQSDGNAEDDPAPAPRDLEDQRLPPSRPRRGASPDRSNIFVIDSRIRRVPCFVEVRYS